jgi:hypothetical protein
VQSVPITTNLVSSNPAHGKVYSIQHYVIKFVSCLRQSGGFLRVLRFLKPKKLTVAMIDSHIRVPSPWISFKSSWNKEDWSAFSSADIIITLLQVGSEKKMDIY